VKQYTDRISTRFGEFAYRRGIVFHKPTSGSSWIPIRIRVSAQEWEIICQNLKQEDR